MRIRKCVLLEMFSFVLIGSLLFSTLLDPGSGHAFFGRYLFGGDTISEITDSKKSCQRDVNVT